MNSVENTNIPTLEVPQTLKKSKVNSTPTDAKVVLLIIERIKNNLATCWAALYEKTWAFKRNNDFSFTFNVNSGDFGYIENKYPLPSGPVIRLNFKEKSEEICLDHRQLLDISTKTTPTNMKILICTLKIFDECYKNKSELKSPNQDHMIDNLVKLMFEDKNTTIQTIWDNMDSNAFPKIDMTNLFRNAHQFLNDFMQHYLLIIINPKQLAELQSFEFYASFNTVSGQMNLLKETFFQPVTNCVKVCFIYDTKNKEIKFDDVTFSKDPEILKNGLSITAAKTLIMISNLISNMIAKEALPPLSEKNSLEVEIKQMWTSISETPLPFEKTDFLIGLPHQAGPFDTIRDPNYKIENEEFKDGRIFVVKLKEKSRFCRVQEVHPELKKYGDIQILLKTEVNNAPKLETSSLTTNEKNTTRTSKIKNSFLKNLPAFASKLNLLDDKKSNTSLENKSDLASEKKGDIINNNAGPKPARRAYASKLEMIKKNKTNQTPSYLSVTEENNKNFNFFW